VSLIAFDLLELNGEDTRPLPLIQRKDWLAKLVAKVRDGIEFSEHIEGDGAEIFRAACELGHEGIVAKRKRSALRIRPVAAEAEDQEPGEPGSQADRGWDVLRSARRAALDKGAISPRVISVPALNKRKAPGRETEGESHCQTKMDHPLEHSLRVRYATDSEDGNHSSPKSPGPPPRATAAGARIVSFSIIWPRA
jgi:hypothetical protein